MPAVVRERLFQPAVVCRLGTGRGRQHGRTCREKGFCKKEPNKKAVCKSFEELSSVFPQNTRYEEEEEEEEEEKEEKEEKEEEEEEEEKEEKEEEEEENEEEDGREGGRERERGGRESFQAMRLSQHTSL